MEIDRGDLRVIFDLAIVCLLVCAFELTYLMIIFLVGLFHFAVEGKISNCNRESILNIVAS